jgi:anti-anti-sigma factor
MKLSLSEDLPTHVRIKLDGNLTHRELPSEGDPLAVLLGPSVYKRRVLLDLSTAQYLDSSGIGWLLSSHKQFRLNGGKFILHSLQPMVMNVVKLLKLDSLLNLALDQRAALDAVREVAV